MQQRTLKSQLAAIVALCSLALLTCPSRPCKNANEVEPKPWLRCTLAPFQAGAVPLGRQCPKFIPLAIVTICCWSTVVVTLSGVKL